MRIGTSLWSIGARVVGGLLVRLATVIRIAVGIARPARAAQCRDGGASDRGRDEECPNIAPSPVLSDVPEGFAAPVTLPLRASMRLRPRVCSDRGHVTGLEIVLSDFSARDTTVPPPADQIHEALGWAAGLQAQLQRDHLAPGRLCLTMPRTVINLDTFVDRIGFALDAHDLLPRDVELRLDHPGAIAASTRLAERLGCALAMPAGCEAIRGGDADMSWIGDSLVRDIATDPARRGLVSGFLRRAERCGLDSVATGVATAADAGLLAQLGCGHLSGPAIAPPLPAEELASWLAARRASGDALARIPWQLDAGIPDALTLPTFPTGAVERRRRAR